MLRYSKYLMFCVGIIVLTAAALVLAGEYRNARNMAFPSDAALQASYARAANWVLGHRGQVLNENTAMLWLFIREAAKAAGDARLSELAQEYQARQTDHNLWRFIFDSTGRERVAAQWM